MIIRFFTTLINPAAPPAQIFARQVGAPTNFTAESAGLTGKRHLPALDGVRGLAVLIVVAYHVGGGAQSHNSLARAIGLMLKTGWSGVTLFFLLSGFLITGILWDSKDSEHWWRNFYVRRFLRISPLYYGSLLAIVIISYLLHKGGSGSQGLWIYALYLQNMPWINDTGANLRPLQLSHFWSLAVEEQFYMIWPFLLYRLKTSLQVRHLCLAVFMFSTVFRCAVWSFSFNPSAYNGFLLSRAGELALGGYLAMRFRDGSWAQLQRLAPYIATISALVFAVLCVVGHAYELVTPAGSMLGLPLITLAYMGLLVLALQPGVINSVATRPWLRRVGGISYGIYIFHVLLRPFYVRLVEILVPRAGRTEGIAIVAGVTVILTAMIAGISFRCFESPILKLREHFQSTP